MFEPDGPNLFKSAEKISCSVLFHLCENDNINLPDSYKKIEKILDKKVKIVKYPIGHFDIYFGEYFEKALSSRYHS